MDAQEEMLIYIRQMTDEQKKTNRLLESLIDLFKKYEIDEVLYSEELRDE
jgi:hypothetical protein